MYFIPTGYEYIAIQTGSKLPLGKCPDGPHVHDKHCSWNVAPSLTVDEVQRILRQGGNYGIRLKDGDMVIDVDKRNGGDETKLGFDIRAFPAVDTPGPGIHGYGRCVAGVTYRKNHPDFPGIDFQTNGSYVLGPECTHPNGGRYLYDIFSRKFDKPHFPAEILKVLEVHKTENPRSSETWDVSRLELVLSQLDVYKFNNHDDWFKLMCACHEATAGEGVDAFIQWSVQDELYSDDERIIRKRWESFQSGQTGNAGVGTLLHIATEHGVKNVGFDDSEAFKAYAVKTEDSIVPLAPLADMNERFYVVQEDGKLRILEIKKSEDLQMSGWVRHTKRDFLEVCQSLYHYPNVELKVKTQDAKGQDKEKSVVVPMAQRWIETPSAGKRVYPGGLVFMPEDARENINGSLNMWRGFAYTPKQGDWSLLQQLTFEILCQSDLESYEYVLNWLARAVQFPAEPARTACVLKGVKGCGKGSLGRSFVRLFGIHGQHVASMDAISGRFNSHLQDCVAMFADEAYWPGDKSAEGVFKALITEPSLHYEAKGLTPHKGRNCIHILMAANGEWIVPAGLDYERRYAVFQALEKIMSEQFFAQLNKQMDNGGQEAMLFDLLARDLSKFNVQSVPLTDALVDQKMQSLGLAEQWIFTLLDSGDWNSTKQYPDTPLLACDLLDNFTQFVGNKSRSIRSMETEMGLALKKYIPNAKKTRITKPSYRMDMITQRPWAYEMPTLEDAKRKFIAAIGKNVFD